MAYEETGTGRHRAGSDGYLRLCRRWTAALPDVRVTVLRTLSTGSTVAQETTWTGTHTGPLEAPSGTIPPTGRRVKVWATLWFTVREGRCVSVRHHLDLHALLGQLGALP
jgi:predicted ester cyclase